MESLQEAAALPGSLAMHIDKEKEDAADAHSQACKRIPTLPEDIWHHIHSLMPLRDAARAACLSRDFLRFWRCRPNLTLNLTTLGWTNKPGEFRCKIDSILRNHPGIGLKTLQLDLLEDEDEITFSDIDRWLQVARTPGIEELILTLFANNYSSLYERQEEYSFPLSLLSDEKVRSSIRCLDLDSCAFRPTPQTIIGPLRSLTNLHLNSVRITGDELECLLSNSLALKELHLFDCDEIVTFKIPPVLRQFRFLHVTECYELTVIENRAPNLSVLEFSGDIIGEISQVKNVRLMRSNVVHYARVVLPSVMPNLEILRILSDSEEVNTPMLTTKFLYLRHLTFRLLSGSTFPPSYDYFLSLVSFLDASPSLETLYLEVRQGSVKSESVFRDSSTRLRQMPEHRHLCLKSVMMEHFSSDKGLVEIACYILKNAVSLECMTLDTNYGPRLNT
ncbi:hypothetical protein QOZ80_8BG0642300 [Eleusine coracana subsp. coracana]|nr:hypothetical protein QOZ80_8BG0642300 [Eleusine coracana subsp. coracana]